MSSNLCVNLYAHGIKSYLSDTALVLLGLRKSKGPLAVDPLLYLDTDPNRWTWIARKVGLHVKLDCM